MAGFQLSINGRFWVSTEAHERGRAAVSPAAGSRSRSARSHRRARAPPSPV